MGNGATSGQHWDRIRKKLIALTAHTLRTKKATMLAVGPDKNGEKNVDNISVYDLLYGDNSGLKGSVNYSEVYRASAGKGPPHLGADAGNVYHDISDYKKFPFEYDHLELYEYCMGRVLSVESADIGQLGIQSLLVRTGSSMLSEKERKMPAGKPDSNIVEGCEVVTRELEKKIMSSPIVGLPDGLKEMLIKIKDCTAKSAREAADYSKELWP